MRIQQNVSINFFVYGNMVIIYELEDTIYCISKLRIDRDFWKVLYLRHKIQEYKNIGMNYYTIIEKCEIQSNWNSYTIALKCDSPHNSIRTLM